MRRIEKHGKWKTLYQYETNAKKKNLTCSQCKLCCRHNDRPRYILLFGSPWVGLLRVLANRYILDVPSGSYHNLEYTWCSIRKGWVHTNPLKKIIIYKKLFMRHPTLGQPDWFSFTGGYREERFVMEEPYLLFSKGLHWTNGSPVISFGQKQTGVIPRSSQLAFTPQDPSQGFVHLL